MRHSNGLVFFFFGPIVSRTTRHFCTAKKRSVNKYYFYKTIDYKSIGTRKKRLRDQIFCIKESMTNLVFGLNAQNAKHTYVERQDTSFPIPYEKLTQKDMWKIMCVEKKNKKITNKTTIYTVRWFDSNKIECVHMQCLSETNMKSTRVEIV